MREWDEIKEKCFVKVKAPQKMLVIPILFLTIKRGFCLKNWGFSKTAKN